MVRYYRRRFRTIGRKWSRECTSFNRNIQDTAGTTVIPLVAAATIGGKRKIGNYQLNIYTGAGILLWALVYVPNGSQPSQLQLGSSTPYYEPSNNLISQGIIADRPSNPLFIRYQRNLNEGDQIVLLVRPSQASQVYGTIGYSICYN